MSPLILFLFCLFLHGSHAGSLDLHGSSYDRKACRFGEVAEKIESMGSISSTAPSNFRPRAPLGSFKTEKQVENDENNLIGVNPTNQKSSKSSQNDSSPSDTKKARVSDEIDLHGKENKTKGRRVLKELGLDEADAAVDLTKKDGEEEEEVVMMDYEQPHRKPPIHNGKP